MVRMRSSFVIGLVVVGFGSAYAMSSASMSAGVSGASGEAKAAVSTIAVAQESDSKEARARVPATKACEVTSTISTSTLLDIFQKHQTSMSYLVNDATRWNKAVAIMHEQNVAALKDGFGRTFLHVAAGNDNNFYLVQAFVAAGCAVDAEDRAGATPFLYAVDSRAYKIAEYLLVCGAKRNVQDAAGWSVVHYAVQNMDLKMLKYLRLKGVNLGLRSKVFAKIEGISEDIAAKPGQGLVRTEGLTPLDLARELLATATAEFDAARELARGQRGRGVWSHVRELEAQVQNCEAIVKLLE